MALATTYRTEWTALPINAGPVPPKQIWQECVTPRATPFFVRYLILMDDGFLISSASVGYREFLHDVWSDVFMVPEWDRLERVGQLDRVKLDARVEPYEHLLLRVQNLFAVDRPLRGAFIGQNVVAEASWSPQIPYLDDEPVPPTQPSPSPRQTPAPSPLLPVARECRDCGAPVGRPCHGMRRWEFHPGRHERKPSRAAPPSQDYWATSLPRASLCRP